MTSPNVVFNYNFIQSLNNTNRKISKAKTIKATQGLFDYYDKDSAKAMNIFDYYSGDINKSEKMNIMLEDGNFATENQIEFRKKQYKKYIENSNLARCVVSFNNDYINSKIDINKLEKIIIKHVLPMYFKKCGYKDPNKMSYQIALHTDTDNLHFHFSYIEKEPNFIYDRNKIGYKRVGMITNDEINFLKNQIEHEIEKDNLYTSLIKDTNKDIEEIKKYFKPGEKNFLLHNKEDLVLEANILKLGELLYLKRNEKKGRIKYNSINNKEIENLTKNIKNYIFSKKNPEFKNELNNFRNSINNLNEYFVNININNNIKDIKSDTTLVDSKKEYIDNYIFNAIVNHADYMYKSKVKNNITENKVIEEIVYKEYLKNKRQSRLSILKNYLESPINKRSFKNKYKIEQAIKNINNEMEDAQKEFSKLFHNNNLEK
jgi:hypothetical protein